MKSLTSPTKASDKSNESARPRSKPASSCASQPAQPASAVTTEQLRTRQRKQKRTANAPFRLATLPYRKLINVQ